ncbi:hypothetical protein [Nakamurella sp.]|uniref:hypothetical protein n=1 Tax=Nakamurella sp. TaxID=1869182 RepID=UPI003B3A1BFD
MSGQHAFRRSALRLLAVTALVLAPAAPAAATPATVPAPAVLPAVTAGTATGAPDLSTSPVLQNLAACIGEKKAGDLVVLIDTSGSLSGAGSSGAPTDPTDVRVAGAQVLLGGLARSFDDVGATVDLTVAGFDDDVTTVVDAVPLNEAALPALDGQLNDFANRDRGAETDYWTALTWLNRTMQAKAAARADAAADCQFAIWFTDGEFTIWPRDGSSQADLDPLNSQLKDIPGFEERPLTDRATADAALAAAKEELCRPGGTADQLRATGVTMIGVGLGGEDGDRFGFMRGIVENPDGTCGREPGRGIFVPAASVGDLFLALAALGEFGAGGVTSTPVCQGQPCPEGTYQFKLDNTISAVHFDAVVDDGSDQLIREGLQVTITPPAGVPMVIDGNGADSGTLMSDTASAQYQWLTGDPLAVDLDRAAGADWTGDWKVTFVDTTGQHPDAVSNISLTLTSDFAIAPVVTDPGDWRVGQSATVTFQTQTLDGEPVGNVTALPPGFTATAEVDLPGAGRPVLPIPVSLTEPVTVDLPADGDPGLAVVIVRVDGQVAGQPLGTVSRQATVPVQPPFGVPVIDPAGQVVDFGAVEGPVPASGSLRVVGPAEGDGCVTVSAGPVQGPRDVSAQVSTPNGAGCYPVPSGQTVQVPLSLTPSTEGNGALTGTLVVGLSSADNPAQVSEQQVDFRLTMTRLPDTGVKVLVLISAFLLGLLIPLLIIWLVRRMSARFPAADQATLQSIVIPVQIGGTTLSAAGGGAVALPADGWVALPPPGPGRRTIQASGVAMRARAGWRFSEPGFAELQNGDDVGVGEAVPPSDKKGRPRFPLAVQGTWAVLAPRQLSISPVDVVQGRLLLIVETRAEPAKRSQLLSRALGAAPTAFADARAKARKAAGTAAPPPGGPAGPGGPGGPAGPGGPGGPPPWGGPTSGPTPAPSWGGSTGHPPPAPWGGAGPAQGSPAPPVPAPPGGPGWGGSAPAPGGWPPGRAGGSPAAAPPPGWGTAGGPGGSTAPGWPSG